MFFDVVIAQSGLDKLPFVRLQLDRLDSAIDDPEIFAPILLGRKTASQQDSWVQYWEGDPTRNTNRKHPLGIKVTQRSMSWNFPSGNESIIYFLFEFENITADPNFQELNEQFFFGGDAALPDGGCSFPQSRQVVNCPR